MAFLEILLSRKEVSHKGLRSPYIFLLFGLNTLVDILNFILNGPETGIGIKTAKNGPMFFYLMPSDGCLIFYKVNRKTAGQ